MASEVMSEQARQIVRVATWGAEGTGQGGQHLRSGGRMAWSAHVMHARPPGQDYVNWGGFRYSPLNAGEEKCVRFAMAARNQDHLVAIPSMDPANVLELLAAIHIAQRVSIAKHSVRQCGIVWMGNTWDSFGMLNLVRRQLLGSLSSQRILNLCM